MRKSNHNIQMRIFIILGILAVCFTNCQFTKGKTKPDTGSFEALANKCELERHQLWEKKEYAQAVVAMKDVYASYQSLDANLKPKYADGMSMLFYNLSCGYALLQQKDSALNYLQKAVHLGYSDYELLIRDSDLIRIRNEQKYIEQVEQLKKTYDFEFILKQAKTYKAETQKLPYFSFQLDYAEVLVNLRNKYKLDSIAGKGDEISQIINLMQWVHRTVRHDGNSLNPKDCCADALIEVCKKEKRGVNCRMLATILNEVYLAEGFQSQFVTCLPKSKTDHDCHVINSVFSKTLNKWLWMDPTFETWVKDDRGNLLSIPEVRERLITGLQVFASPCMNWNGKPSDPDNYLHHYMAKNLFQIRIPKKSSSGYENWNYQDRTYVQLISLEYQSEYPELNGLKDQVYYTTDSEKFWKHPE